MSKTVTWSSSNTSVASVSSSGKVTAVANGTAIITARTVNGKTATCNVTVNIPVPASSVKINQGAFTLTKKGATKQLTVTVNPSNASNKTVTWSSSNKKVATVSSTGKVTAVANGTATITAKTANGKKTTVKVTVKIMYPTAIKITTKAFSLTKKGATKTIAYSLSGKGITDKTVTWSSSKSSVAKVDSKGKVTAVANGTATITAKTANGKKATVKVTVKVPAAVSSVKINQGAFTLTKKGATKQLTVTVSPSNASNKTVTWSSSNKKVATVSSAGKVTAVANGTATITAKSSNGKTATVRATVKIATSAKSDAQVAREIFDAYNEYRASKGLKKVGWDSGLATEALKSAKACAEARTLNHTADKRIGRSQFTERIGNRIITHTTGYSDILQYSTWRPTGTEAVQAWSKSDGHRKMMQCASATKAGVALYKSGGTWYYAIVYNWVDRNQDGK